MVLSSTAYDNALEDLLFGALNNFGGQWKGKRVLLKPNLVEHAPGVPINTHPTLIGAAATAFQRLGAALVLVGEGPGHVRDTQFLLEQTGLASELRQRRVPFIDLNRDSVQAVRTGARYTGMKTLWLPLTALAADLIVSMPKVKTHHWAGVTLSMKNMFGILPGSQYGWPKNALHWAGIHESVLDVCSTVRPGFVIADAIEAMEGNGPLHGSRRHLGKIVLADDPVAADATCMRLMGLRPAAVRHVMEAGAYLGNMAEERISMLGEQLPRRCVPFELLPQFQSLRDSRVCGD